MPLDAYKEVFGHLPDKGVRAPYFLSFYGIISHLVGYYQLHGETEPIDFIFDIQPGHAEIVIAAWERFLEVAPPEKRWSHFLRQGAKVDSPMQRTTHHEDAETVFG
jgi:hypothetical protein